jgi:hypothetical protein
MTFSANRGLGIILCSLLDQSLLLPERLLVFLSVQLEFCDPPRCKYDAWMLPLCLKPIVKPLQFFEWFQDRACSMPKDDALIAELTSPTYAFTSTGKMVVESKADMKKRGLRSPDLADAFLLTFACGERRKERYRRPVRRCSAWAA